MLLSGIAINQSSKLMAILVGLTSPEVDAFGAEIGRAGFLRRAFKYVGLPGDLKIYETGSLYQGLQLCFQQSTGNSTSP